MDQERTKIKKKATIEALIKTLGVITSACKIVEINRATFYEWYANDTEFAEEVDSISDIALDFAESKLHGLIKDENATAIIFYLKTKGKKRGYIEKQEIDHTTKGEKLGSPEFVFKNLNEEKQD